MHSYYALSTLFMLHDQGLLLPFLSHLAGENPQTPPHRRREGLDSVPSPVKHSPVNDCGLINTNKNKDDARRVMRISDRKDMLQSPEPPGVVSLRNGPLDSDEVLARRAARFGRGLTSLEGPRGKVDRGVSRLAPPDAPRGKTSQSPKRRTLSAEGRTQRSPDKRARGVAQRTPSPTGRG